MRLFPFHPRKGLRRISAETDAVGDVWTSGCPGGGRVRYRQPSETRRRQIRYGALAIALLLLAAGMIAFSHSNQRSGDTPQAAAPRRAQATAPAVNPSTTSPDDLTPAVSTLRRDEA